MTANSDPQKKHISKRNALPNIILSYYLEGRILESSQDKGFHWNADAASMSSISQAQSNLIQFPYSGSSAENKSIPTSTISELHGFIESLEKFPDISLWINIEKTEILAVIDLLCEVCSPDSASAYQSLDEPGRRYS